MATLHKGDNDIIIIISARNMEHKRGNVCYGFVNLFHLKRKDCRYTGLFWCENGGKNLKDLFEKRRLGVQAVDRNCTFS